MLKLEQSCRNNQIVISLKSRSVLSSTNMIRAFTIALGIHLSAYLLFTVSSSSSSDIALFPPVHVETDPNIHFGVSNLNTSKIDHHGLLTYAPEKPSHSLPSQPSLPKNLPIQHQAFTKDVTLVEIPVRQIEHSLYRQLDEQPSVKKSPSLLNIRLTGGLASRHLKKTCRKKIQTILKNATIPSCASILYHVKLEEQTGKLFHFVKTAGNPENEVSAVADKILQSLRIEGEKENVLTEGMIELFFSTEEIDETGPQIIFNISDIDQ
jgi:hypothetical protein